MSETARKPVPEEAGADPTPVLVPTEACPPDASAPRAQRQGAVAVADSTESAPSPAGETQPTDVPPAQAAPPTPGQGTPPPAGQASRMSAVSTEAPEAPPAAKRYMATIYPGERHPLHAEFAKQVLAFQDTLDLPLCLLVQNSDDEHGEISPAVVEAFLDQRHLMRPGQPIALLIHSPGGLSRCAFQLASILRRHCGGFHATIPRYAKSAATLLALGEDEIYLGEYGELGPLDVQIEDPHREARISGLDEVQSLERLNAHALQCFDQFMFLAAARTRKKIAALLPNVLSFVASMMRPLLEQVEVVQYTQISRQLKEAEEYTTRLLQPRYPHAKAQTIARALVERFPTHDFVVGLTEARALGLDPKELSAVQNNIVARMNPFLREVTAIGPVREVGTHES
jgi:hypothetical protein